MNATHILLVTVAVVIVVLIAILAVVLKKRTPVTQCAAKSCLPPLDSVIVEGIEKNALRFIGLYEGIYTAVDKQMPDAADAYREWHIRMSNLQENERFCEAFTARFPQTNVQLFHLQELLRYIDAAGIRRDAKQFHIAQEDTSKQYIYLGGDELCAGKEYKVLKPCWVQGDIIVEQGILAPKEGL